MRETDADLEWLQRLLDSSYAGAGAHLLSIHTPEHRLDAGAVAARLDGVRVLALATVSADGRPLVGPVDGIFHRARFWFGTGPGAVRARHLAQRPAVSATHADGEAWAVTVHGEAHRREVDGDFADQCREIYGAGWVEWGPENPYFRIEPRVMFTFSHS